MSTDYCQCEKPDRRSEKMFCHACQKEIEKKEKLSESRARKLKEHLAKYDEKDLRFMYFRSKIRPDIIITAVSKINRDTNTLRVAFSFCSPKDCFCKLDGKNECFERLEDEKSPFAVTVPWLDDGYLTVGFAFNQIEKPEKLKRAKFDSLIMRDPVYFTTEYYG